jgi:glycine cleavage system transcriptional repressor
VGIDWAVLGLGHSWFDGVEWAWHVANVANQELTKRYMVLTAVGHDRPGLVQRIAALIHTEGGNLEDSRMAILGGEFALILLFSGSSNVVEAISSKHVALGEELELTMSLRSTVSQRPRGEYLAYRLKVVGEDRPGIVVQVTEVLSRMHINVAALDSSISHAAHSGTPMFQLLARLEIPSRTAFASLRSELARLCEQENLDFTLESA